MAELTANPMAADGFEFIEYTAREVAPLRSLFERLGFRNTARHRSEDVGLYRQGDINGILNAEPDSFAQAFARIHGPSICAIAFRVADAGAAHRRAIALGAKPVESKIIQRKGNEGFEQWFDTSRTDFAPYDRELKRRRNLDPGVVVADDRLIEIAA